MNGALDHAQRKPSQMEAYMNTLNGTVTPVPGSSVAQPSELTSPEQVMQRQLEEFNRSVTIIIWYKSNIDPIRLQQTIPTFPYFQLSHFGSLVSDLGLTTASYLDTYNPSTGQWEQHTVKTVRLVESQQRVLYRVRKSLLEGIREDECLSLHEEVQTQLRPNHIEVSSPLATIKSPNKRPATEALETGQAQKTHVTNSYYPAIAVPPTPSSISPTSASPNDSPTNNNATTTTGGYIYQAAPFYNSPPPTSTASPSSPSASILPPYLTSPHAPTPPIPYHPHPPLKRWPNDYTVSELANGFLAMETLVTQSSMTQRAAFERVFGSRYVKSTVCRHRAVWRRANRGLREQFEAMGSDERACWGEFVRRVEGRPPGKGVQEFATAVYAERDGMSQQNATESMGEPSVMDSLQNSSNSGPSNPRPVPLQNGSGMNVFDPALNHLSNSGHS